MTVLTDPQIQTLRAAVDRIIPEDDYPGAWGAGVGEYLGRQMHGNPQFPRDIYRAGLDALDVEAQLQTGEPFCALSAAAQDDLLAQIEIGRVVSSWQVDPAAFFAFLVHYTMEGYYSDPDNGGNQDGIAWKMIGFEVRG